MLQEESAAQLFRAGRKWEAREARHRLYVLINQLDLMEEISSPLEHMHFPAAAA